MRKLQEATANPENHVYSPYEGTMAFKKAVADWFQERFKVALNPDTEVYHRLPIERKAEA